MDMTVLNVEKTIWKLPMLMHMLQDGNQTTAQTVEQRWTRWKMIDYEILQDIITDHELYKVQENELAKVVELLKSDRLIELPCKVGDTVYLIGKNYHKCPNHYDCEHYDHEEYLIIWCERNCPNGFRGTGVIQAIVETIEVNREQVLVQLNAHGNYLRVPIASVFLTKEEAEEALKRL